MSRERSFVIASVTRGLLLGGMRAGLDPRDLLKRVDLKVDEVEDGDTLIAYDKHVELTRLIFTHRPQANISLMIGSHFTPNTFGLLGHVMEHAATFEQALGDFNRFQALTTNIVVREVTPVPEGCRVTVITHPSFAGIPALHEAPLAVPLAFGRKLTGQRITPLRVSFRHKPIGDAGEHQEFFGLPIQFGASADEIVFSRETLDLPLIQANSSLHQRALEHILARVDPLIDLRPVGAALRQRLLRTLHERIPRKPDIARSMGMSTRTLQRRLEGEGTTFEVVLDRTRRDLALEFLVDPSRASFEIAGLLGYGEPSTFFRAFRRWFGCTPKEWRHGQRIT